MKKILSIILCIFILCQVLAVSVSATSSPFFGREEYGNMMDGEGIYIVSKEETELRDMPQKEGVVLRVLHQGTPVKATSILTNFRGTRWISTVDDGEVCYVNLNHLEVHHHSMVDLDDYGVPGYEACPICGYIELQSDEDSVLLDAEDIDPVEFGLTVCSFVPGVDTLCDIASAVRSIINGDRFDAAVSLAGAVPFIGETFDSIKAGSFVDKVFVSVDGNVIYLKGLDGGKYIEIAGDKYRANLSKNLDRMYEATGDIRYYPGDDMVAHHIVSFSDKNADEARRILESVNIGTNSPFNGVRLCKSDNCFDPTTAMHRGRHTKEYNELVTNRLKDALDSVEGGNLEDRQRAVISALDGLAHDLMDSKIDLHKIAA